MDWLGFVLTGIFFNFIFAALSHKAKIRIRGIDSMPAIPIAAGFALGSVAGATIGAVLSMTYHIMKPSTFGSLPLTFIGNIVAGLLGALVSPLGFLAGGILILFVYHIISLALTLTISQPSPGYIMFIGMNVVTTIVLLVVMGSVVGI